MGGWMGGSACVPAFVFVYVCWVSVTRVRVCVLLVFECVCVLLVCECVLLVCECAYYMCASVCVTCECAGYSCVSAYYLCVSVPPTITYYVEHAFMVTAIPFAPCVAFFFGRATLLHMLCVLCCAVLSCMQGWTPACSTCIVQRQTATF